MTTITDDMAQVELLPTWAASICGFIATAGEQAEKAGGPLAWPIRELIAAQRAFFADADVIPLARIDPKTWDALDAAGPRPIRLAMPSKALVALAIEGAQQQDAILMTARDREVLAYLWTLT